MFQNLKTKIGFNVKGSTRNRKKNKKKYLECRARKKRLVNNIAYNRKK